MGRSSFAIDVVETGYRLDGSASEWFDRVLAQLSRELELGLGVFAVTYRFDAKQLQLGQLVGRGCPDTILQFTRAMYEHLPGEVSSAIRRSPGDCQAISEFSRLLPAGDLRGPREALASLGLADGLMMAHPDGEGGWLAFGAYSARPLRTVPGQRTMWRRVCAHLATGWRLRGRLGTSRAALEAVVSRKGRVVSAEGEAAERRNLVRLEQAARSIDRARGSLRYRAPMEAMELWKGLVAGRWSLIERVEADGARVLVAHQNAPHLRDPRGLSARESAVVELAMTGASNKQIAYALGLSAATVSGHLASAQAKLRVSSRAELIGLGLARMRAEAGRTRVGEDELGMLVLEAEAETIDEPLKLDERLTGAERDVARLVARGMSNAAIAAQRGSSVRTVANQLASIFGKLGVFSRSELVLALSGPPRKTRRRSLLDPTH